jgi:hypothetical protein
MPSLQIVRSETNPAAYLSLRLIEGGAVPGEVAQMRFMEPRLPLEDQPYEPLIVKFELTGLALATMARLLAPNIEAKNETGPSAGTDEPGSMTPNNLKDRRRVGARKRSKSA